MKTDKEIEEICRPNYHTVSRGDSYGGRGRGSARWYRCDGHFASSCPGNENGGSLHHVFTFILNGRLRDAVIFPALCNKVVNPNMPPHMWLIDSRMYHRIT